MTHTQAVNTGAAERYLLDEMSELERHSFENHYFSCLECAEDVRMGGMMRAGVKSGMVASSQRSVRWQSSVVMPWAVAATLALAVGYQSLVVGPQSPLQPQALSPITLRAASRGADAIVPIRPGSDAVTLAVDLAALDAPELSYELRSGDDRNVASGRVAAPPPGAPLLLLIPARTLTPAGSYNLVVRHATTGNLISEIRFSVAGQ